MSHIRAECPESLPAAEQIDEDGLFFGNHHYDIGEAVPVVAEVLASL